MGFSKDNTRSGAFYIQKPDGTEEEFLCMGDIPDIEFTESSDEAIPTPYQLNDSAELSFSVSAMDLDMLNRLCEPIMPTDNFTIEYNIPIMIQTRWHKKARIRKKWLKRFGMKPDTIKVRADAHMLEYHPGQILDEQHDDSGICATFDGWEFETNKLEYVLRPDQKRKGLKIEW